jgi:long-chain acyl-CoA synthetase
MEWVSLTMEIAERAGIELPEEEVAEMETVRDLLQSAAEAAEGSAPDLSEDPEQNLEEGDRRWLRPLGPLERVLASLVYHINWGAVRLIYRLEVRGIERLPDEERIVITPNHLSALDPFVLAASIGRRRLLEIYWGGWVGIAFANPLTRAVSRLAKAVPIDPRRGAISSLALAASVLKRGKGLIWFPEGERSPDGELQQLKPGVGVLLDAQPSKVVPVAIAGTQNALPPGSLVPRPLRRLQVIVGESVDTEALADEGKGDDRATRIVDALQQRLEELVEGS